MAQSTHGGSWQRGNGKQPAGPANKKRGRSPSRSWRDVGRDDGHRDAMAACADGGVVGPAPDARQVLAPQRLGANQVTEYRTGYLIGWAIAAGHTAGSSRESSADRRGRSAERQVRPRACTPSPAMQINDRHPEYQNGYRNGYVAFPTVLSSNNTDATSIAQFNAGFRAGQADRDAVDAARGRR